MTTAVELDGQYRALREEAGMAWRERGWLGIAGADAAEYLQGQLTNDIEALETGQGCYAALLDRKGRMQADMRVLAVAADEISIDLEPEAVPAALRHLTMYSVGREVAIHDRGAERAALAVAGPAALALVGAPPLGTEHDHLATAIEGVEVRAVRTDVGLDLIVAAAHREPLEAALAARGVAPVEAAALEIVRVEAGRPRFGREMTTETIPQEAGINERAVSFTKGCYIGQETVARLHYKGRPNRHLRGLRLSGPAAAGAEVRLGERVVGRIGTAVLSPALGPIALAILRREAEPGATVSVESPDGTGTPVSAEVVEPPFSP